MSSVEPRLSFLTRICKYLGIRIRIIFGLQVRCVYFVVVVSAGTLQNVHVSVDMCILWMSKGAEGNHLVFKFCCGFVNALRFF